MRSVGSRQDVDQFIHILLNLGVQGKEHFMFRLVRVVCGSAQSWDFSLYVATSILTENAIFRGSVLPMCDEPLQEKLSLTTCKIQSSYPAFLKSCASESTPPNRGINMRDQKAGTIWNPRLVTGSPGRAVSGQRILVARIRVVG